MLIGSLARLSGLSKEGIRYYESLGLIYSNERIAGTRVYREYQDNTLDRLELIRISKNIGFKLKELKPLLDLYFSGDITAKQANQVIKDKLSEVDSKIESLLVTKEILLRKLKLTSSEKSFQKAQKEWAKGRSLLK